MKALRFIPGYAAAFAFGIIFNVALVQTIQHSFNYA
jgi:hypothetical protein